MSSGLRMLLFASLTIALIWTVDCQTPITCTAGHYKPGEKATITCHFHGEVTTDQNTGVYITWFDLDAPKDSSGKEVLMCHFSGGAVSVCKPEDGYRFVSFKNNLTIEVPDVSAEFQGRYSCGVVPANGRSAHPCFLLVEGAFVQPQDAPPEKPETNEKLHKHVKTTHTLVIITFLIIIIIVAAAAIIYVALAYKKNWLPFRKDAVKSNKNEEKAGMLEKGDSGLTGTPSVIYKPSVQECTKEPLLDNSRAAPSPQVEFRPLPNKEDTETRDSQSVASTVMKEDKAEEKKIETKKEKQEREKREKAEKNKKEAEEERQKKERKAERERRLKDAASKEEKTRIKDDFAAEEKRLKQKKNEEDKARKESEKGKK